MQTSFRSSASGSAAHERNVTTSLAICTCISTSVSDINTVFTNQQINYAVVWWHLALSDNIGHTRAWNNTIICLKKCCSFAQSGNNQYSMKLIEAKVPAKVPPSKWMQWPLPYNVAQQKMYITVYGKHSLVWSQHFSSHIIIASYDRLK